LESKKIEASPRLDSFLPPTKCWGEENCMKDTDILMFHNL
jgi:hypothetical protein